MDELKMRPTVLKYREGRETQRPCSDSISSAHFANHLCLKRVAASFVFAMNESSPGKRPRLHVVSSLIMSTDRLNTATVNISSTNLRALCDANKDGK